MIPSPDFYIKLSIEISEEVIRTGVAGIVCIVAIYGIVKIATRNNKTIKAQDVT